MLQCVETFACDVRITKAQMVELPLGLCDDLGAPICDSSVVQDEPTERGGRG